MALADSGVNTNVMFDEVGSLNDGACDDMPPISLSLITLKGIHSLKETTLLSCYTLNSSNDLTRHPLPWTTRDRKDSVGKGVSCQL
jgi:hypothetical protein